MLLILVLLSIWSAESINYFENIQRCLVSQGGEEYIGTVSTTRSGKKCLMWSQGPKDRDKLIRERTFLYKNNVRMAENFCRKTDLKGSVPWCYYGENDEDWEECNVPICEREVEMCKDTESGQEYDGFLNVTNRRRTCQQWATQNPHTHRFNKNDFPEKDLNNVGNKCRNPNNESTPWCFTTDSKIIFEYCNIPLCIESKSQAEYFRGSDHFGKFALEHVMEDMVSDMKVVVSISKEILSNYLRKKTSVWATQYSSACQRDLYYYDYCYLDHTNDNGDKEELVYNCRNPLLSVVIITPLEKEKYTIEWKKGPVYAINNPLSLNIERYIEEVNMQKQIETSSIPLSGNGGPFHLLTDNVVPYAVTTDNKVVMSISKVGKGRLGLMGAEYFTDSIYDDKLQDFYEKVFGTKKTKPEHIAFDNFQSLENLWKSKKSFKASFIWNAHNFIGGPRVKTLLLMIQDGMNLVIGIKPWVYDHYKEKLRDSEIKRLLLSAGVWPSLDMVYGDLRIIKDFEYQLLPLENMFEYAKTNKTAAARVSEIISDRLSTIPFSDFSEDPASLVLMSTLKEKISDLYNTHASLIKSLVPCIAKPLQNEEQKLLLKLYNAVLINPLGNVFSAPGINFYPGKVDIEEVKPESVQIKINAKFSDESIFLGVFVPQSQTVTISLKTMKSKKCSLFVNFYLFDVSYWDRWDKWPSTMNNYTILSGVTTSISSSFGGLLSISCDTKDDTVEVKLTNIVRVAMYDRRDGPVGENWHYLKKRNVPWAILAADSIVFIVPSLAIRNMEDPEPVMVLWDKMIKEEFHLRGRSIISTRRELLSADFQIKAGYMHAGYPIGTFIQSVANPKFRRKYLFAREKLIKEAFWGVTHEVGHNLQHQIFTFFGTVDVTNNVFTLLTEETMTRESSWDPKEGWIRDHSLTDLVNHINQRNFSFWQANPFVGLGTYAQLRAEFGWEFYRQIFRRYDEFIPEYDKRANPMTDEERIQIWMIESSKIVKMNLLPLYDYWAWPINENTAASLAKLPLFLPDDFLTKMTTEKVNEILKKYGGESSVTRKPLPILVVIGPLKDSSLIEGNPVIKEMTFI